MNIMPDRRLWLIDGSYIYMSQSSIGAGFKLDYKKLKNKIEVDGSIFQAYYVNSTPDPPT